MNKLKNIILVSIIAIVVIGAGMFFAGMKYAGSRTPSSPMRQSANGGPGLSGGNSKQNGGQKAAASNAQGFLDGEIISKTDKSITVKAKDGSSKIVYFSDSTTVSKSAEGSVSDLDAGQQVIVNGKSGSDGTLSAQNIQIRPNQSD
jgi:hypothetical protein